MDFTQPTDHSADAHIYFVNPLKNVRHTAVVRRNPFCRKAANAPVPKRPVDTLGLMMDAKAQLNMLITARRQLRQAQQPGGNRADAIIAQQNITLLRNQLTASVNALNLAFDNGQDGQA